ncbi:MAG TPA: CYTH domain-containing protein [Candidatus Wallbacteria bacterium]|nr:MAG: CYTH domain protein [bacterium ADurb.Bin243]HOD40208.1 CYTH domain-containing protein [Candidatus Wallbacteria bacterium]HPG57949.1 CYTH domain-containing protein [Candidatus Wallbacteria bacterium]
MGKEIERKFIVSGNGYKQAGEGVICRQGYLSTQKERIVRVRLIGDEGFITIKGLCNGISRPEYEYKIPAADAIEMLDFLCEKPLIEKIRYKINFGGRLWEIDEFAGENSGLIIAEIELRSEGEKFEKPSWAGEEVSNDPRYFNSNLIKTPYSLWKKC